MNYNPSSATELTDWQRGYPHFVDGPHARPVLSVEGGWRAIGYVLGLLTSLLAVALVFSP